MRIRIDDSIYKELGEKLSENVYREHYILKKIDKRIMTIHSSKGLEANKVLLFVCYEDYWYNKNPEDRDGKYRNYFVAFSRAEKELHIFYQAKITKKYGTFDVKQVHIIDKINVAYQQLLSSKKATPSENE
jgi:superfamily I DNA/RNA helicase